MAERLFFQNQLVLSGATQTALGRLMSDLSARSEDSNIQVQNQQSGS